MILHLKNNDHYGLMTLERNNNDLYEYPYNGLVGYGWAFGGFCKFYNDVSPLLHFTFLNERSRSK